MSFCLHPTFLATCEIEWLQLGCRYARVLGQNRCNSVKAAADTGNAWLRHCGFMRESMALGNLVQLGHLAVSRSIVQACNSNRLLLC